MRPQPAQRCGGLGAASRTNTFLLGETIMHGCTFARLATALAFTCALAVAATAPGQQYAPTLVADPGYAQAHDAAVGNHLVSANLADAPKDLEKRVKDLESALKKIKDKEAADKKKAAGAMSAKVGGRIFVDHNMFGQDAASRARFTDAQDTTYFRTVRLFVEGEGFCNSYYKAEIDFAGRSNFSTNTVLDHTHTDPQGGATGAAGTHGHTISGAGQILFKDVYLGIKELPLIGRAQVGHFKEPFSVEELTSSRFITFEERALPNALVPGRNIGAMFLKATEAEYATFAAGIFRQVGENPPFLATDNGNWAGTCRTTWLPWYDEATDGRGLLHIGGAYSYRDTTNQTGPDGSTFTLAARPETGAGVNILNASLTTVTNYHLIGQEVALVWGPLSIQAEYVGAQFNRSGAGVPDAYADGGYCYLSWFLTGENRNYKRAEGRFDRVKPNTNFFRVRTEDCVIETGWGAWELGYRYSFLNATDAAFTGRGYVTDHTLGCNWYLNPYMRVMFNFVHGQNLFGADDYIDGFTMRAQVDF
jgi:phosphate-selective porin OprO/OprP